MQLWLDATSASGLSRAAGGALFEATCATADRPRSALLCEVGQERTGGRGSVRHMAHLDDPLLFLRGVLPRSPAYSAAAGSELVDSVWPRPSNALSSLTQTYPARLGAPVLFHATEDPVMT